MAGDERRSRKTDPRLRTSDGAYNQVGTRVKKRREELRMTQDALCARLASVTEARWNPDRRDIYKIERATRTVTDLELLALSTTLECDAAWLLTGNLTTHSMSAISRIPPEIASTD